MRVRLLSRRLSNSSVRLWIAISIITLVSLIAWVQNSSKVTKLRERANLSNSVAIAGDSSNTASARINYVVIDHLRFKTKRVVLASEKPEIHCTVVLNRVSETAIPVKGELRAVLAGNQLGPVIPLLTQSIPAAERAERLTFAVPAEVKEGTYLLRILQSDGMTSHASVLNVVATSPETALDNGKRDTLAVVYTPVTDITLEDPATPVETPLPDPDPEDDGEPHLVSVPLSVKPKLPKVGAGALFYLTARTESETEKENPTNPPNRYRIRLILDQLEEPGNRVARVVRDLRPEQQYHTYGFYTTESLDKTGKALGKGTYRLTVVRVKAADGEELQPQSIKFKVN
jgi:hypothetical protein